MSRTPRTHQARTHRVPVLAFDRLKPPETEDPEISTISKTMGEALSTAFASSGVPADVILEVFAVWVAAIINVNPTTKTYLENHFMDFLNDTLQSYKP